MYHNHEKGYSGRACISVHDGTIMIIITRQGVRVNDISQEICNNRARIIAGEITTENFDAGRMCFCDVHLYLSRDARQFETQR